MFDKILSIYDNPPYSEQDPFSQVELRSVPGEDSFELFQLALLELFRQYSADLVKCSAPAFLYMTPADYELVEKESGEGSREKPYIALKQSVIVELQEAAEAELKKVELYLADFLELAFEYIQDNPRTSKKRLLAKWGKLKKSNEKYAGGMHARARKALAQKMVDSGWRLTPFWIQ